MCFSCKNVFTVNQNPFSDSIAKPKAEHQQNQRYKHNDCNQGEDNSFVHSPRQQSRWVPDYLSQVKMPGSGPPVKSEDGSYRMSELYPDILNYPGVYPMFNPYSFYPWFAHYWDLYEKEFEDLVERREKYELFKELLRNEEHEYLNINRPKEKYRAVNHLLSHHKKITEKIDSAAFRSAPNNYLIKFGDKDKPIRPFLSNSNNMNQKDLNSIGSSFGQIPTYKYKESKFSESNSSNYEKELNYGKIKDNSKYLTPTLDRHMNYESYKSYNGFRRRYPDYSLSNREGYNNTSNEQNQ